MQAVVITADRHLALVEARVPRPGPGEVRIEVSYCGICGSDLHRLYDSIDVVPGHILGHEFSGTVAELGNGVWGWTLGDRVVVLPIDPCGTCPTCSGASGEICREGLSRGPGLGRPGGLAESVVVPVGMLHRLPAQLDDRAAALVEPLAVAVRGVERSRAARGEAVIVLGGGPIGILTVLALRARGVSRIALVEPNPARRTHAERLGILAVGPDSHAKLPDLLETTPRKVIDCSGHPSGMAAATELLPPGGTVVLLGLAFQPVPMDLLAFGVKELSLIGSLAYTTRDYDEAISHLAAGRIPLDIVITKIAPLAEAELWVRHLRDPASTHVKVLLDPRR